MNEFTAKKIGEVLAFAHTTTSTLFRAQEALEEAYGSDYLSDAQEKSDELAAELLAIVGKHGMEDIAEAKAERTKKKLETMQEQYIGDEWDNPVELLEWHSFFEGAGVGHWALVQGAAKGLGLKDLEAIAGRGHEFFHTRLHTTLERLQEVGEEKAK